MKNFISFCAVISLFCCATQMSAQYVSIPDANFRAFLQQRYPACFNTQGQMDTTCTAITTATEIDCNNQSIADLSGIQYFDGLQTLRCYQNLLTTLPRLPISLTTLDCSTNQLTSLSALPPNLVELICGANFIPSLPALPGSLLRLWCYVNPLGVLPTLPSDLGDLDCRQTGLSELPILPNGLVYLSAGYNPISCLPQLPLTLQGLDVPNTQIRCIPNFTNFITAANNIFPLCIANTCYPELCDGSGTDCVFPGDTNHDGICNNLDVLPISVLDGQVGVTRANRSNNWYGQPCANWNVTIPNTAFDAKFADATGENTIDSMDMNVIYTNYNRTNNGTIPTNRNTNNMNAAFPISIVFTRDTFNISTSDTITADIFIGNTTLTADNFYGVAASVTYDSTFFTPVSIQYNTASFMGSEQQVNVFGIKNTPAQKYDIAIARRTHTNVTGQGRVARIKGIIAENVAGKGAHSRLTNSIGFSLGLSNILAINNVNQSLPTNGISDQCQLVGVTVATENTPDFLDKTISITPNPATNNGALQIGAKNCVIERIELSDILGNILLTQKDSHAIFIENLSPAFYFVRIYTDKGICTKKIVVQ